MQKMIADLSMIDVMTVSSTLRLLEKKELICRSQDNTDTRANRITNTEQGKSYLKKAVKSVEEVDMQFFQQSGIQIKDFNFALSQLKQRNNIMK